MRNYTLTIRTQQSLERSKYNGAKRHYWSKATLWVSSATQRERSDSMSEQSDSNRRIGFVVLQNSVAYRLDKAIFFDLMEAHFYRQVVRRRIQVFSEVYEVIL